MIKFTVCILDSEKEFSANWGDDIHDLAFKTSKYISKETSYGVWDTCSELWEFLYQYSRVSKEVSEEFTLYGGKIKFHKSKGLCFAI